MRQRSLERKRTRTLAARMLPIKRGHFWLKRLGIIGGIMGVMMVAGTLGWMWRERISSFWNEWAPNVAIDTSASLGLVLKNVYVEGQQHTKNEDIISALNVEIGQPVLTIVLEDIHRRLLRLDWMKYAVVERQLPDTLHIRLIERQPIALWQNAGQLFLVDEEGSVIREGDLRPFAKLVILIGEDAPLYAHSLLTMLQDEPSLYAKVSSATRIGQRRWNVRFSNGLEVKLPEENPTAAWHVLATLHQKQNIFSQRLSVIDLRIPDRLYITPKTEAARTPTGEGE